jgi:proton-translocating NAD(P)+ transhydrogenase subunit alpha
MMRAPARPRLNIPPPQLRGDRKGTRTACARPAFVGARRCGAAHRAPWACRGGALPLLTLMLAFFPVPAIAVGGQDVSPFVYQFTVFVIAIFVGYYVVWSVTPALHTPLMSVTNAISSVIVVGALLAVGVSLIEAGSGLAKAFGFLALSMAAVNIFGGFLVTQRMLGMYKKREPKR